MLHDRRQRHGEGPGELADRNVLALVELRQQRAPRRVGKGGEGAVEGGVLILNHVVKCKGHAAPCQARLRCGVGIAKLAKGTAACWQLFLACGNPGSPV
jgi:hypothetical protein